MESARAIRELYGRLGYAGPFPVTDALAIGAVIDEIRALKAAADPDDLQWGRNRHLDSPRIARICRLASVVARVNEILGPDLLLWRTQIFDFAARGMGIGWHQDEFPEHVRSPDGSSHCSVQIALVTSTKINCLAVIPGSHLWDREELRAKGYTTRANDFYPEWDVPRDVEVVNVPTHAGEFLVFHPQLIHASVWSRTLRLGGAPIVLQHLSRFSRVIASKLAMDASERHTITLRIVTPTTPVLPSAFERTVSRVGSVVLSGTDTAGVNQIAQWPC